jgi:starch synthase
VSEPRKLRVLYLTREYPPAVYGGAGVHVEHLAREMAELAEVEVRCFADVPEQTGPPRVRAVPWADPALADHPDAARTALQAVLACARATTLPTEADVVHAHTWYAHWGGILCKLAYGCRLIVTVHSLEPLRPWKREHLGRGYDLSLWIERRALELADAVIAVSSYDRRDILRLFDVAEDRVRVVPNGIDTRRYRPVDPAPVLARHRIDAGRPYVLCLGRLTRQKGLVHFLRAAGRIAPRIQAVLCAAGAESPELEAEVAEAAEALRRAGRDVIWIREMLPRDEAIALYSGAAVFCCPSIYEPFGIINLEAMACETPVVASAVGGIREVVVDGETGILVPFVPISADDPEPSEPGTFAADLARAIDDLIGDPERARELGRRGRERAQRDFGWETVARRTCEIYRELIPELHFEEPR